MAGTTLTYEPGKTLGRSGYVPSTTAKLHEKIEHLDALLSTICRAPEGDDSTYECGFWAMNTDIQSMVLHLASTLATEINELNQELVIAEVNASFTRKSSPLDGQRLAQ